MTEEDYICLMNVFEHFRNLVSIPSPSWKEDGVSSYIISRMTEHGYFFRDDAAGNLLFWNNPTGAKTMIVCHMDTVERAVEAHMLEDDGYFFTDGHTALGADDKAAIAAVMAIASKHPDALFLFTRAEELGLRGSARLEKSFFEPFSFYEAYILDAAGDVGTAIISAPGKNRIEITMLGRTAHAGFSPEKGINAIKAAARAVDLNPSGRIDEETTCNVGSFIAAGSTNIVPDKATVTYEVRSLSDEKRKRISDEIISNAAKAAEDFNAQCRTELTDLYSPYVISESDEALIRALDAAEAIGRDGATKATSGGSDTNNIRNLGIDAITLCIGYENAHSVNERIAKSEMTALVALISALLSL